MSPVHIWPNRQTVIRQQDRGEVKSRVGVKEVRWRASFPLSSFSDSNVLPWLQNLYIYYLSYHNVLCVLNRTMFPDAIERSNTAGRAKHYKSRVVSIDWVALSSLVGGQPNLALSQKIVKIWWVVLPYKPYIFCEHVWVSLSLHFLGSRFPACRNLRKMCFPVLH